MLISYEDVFNRQWRRLIESEARRGVSLGFMKKIDGSSLTEEELQKFVDNMAGTLKDPIFQPLSVLEPDSDTAEVYRVIRPGIPLDLKEHLPVCDCEMWEQGEEAAKAWHYLRLCWNCGNTWYSLHCPHDGCQGRCDCGARGMQVHEYEPLKEVEK